MPRIKQQTVYQFDELDDRAKEKARDWYRQGAFDHDWYDYIFDDAKACLAIAGFRVDEIYFSGFSSQGDGACFEGSWRATEAKPAKAMKDHAPEDKELHRIAAEMRRIAKAYPNASMSCKPSGRYSHEYNADINVELNPPEDDDDIPRTPAEWDALAKSFEPFTDAIIEASRDAMRWIYRQLEAEWNYQNSDEQVDETIRANEYEFDEKGNRT